MEGTSAKNRLLRPWEWSRNALARRGFSQLAALLLVLPLAGCVMVPYTPSAESTRTPYPLEFEEEIIVSIGPRKLLDNVAKNLVKNASISIELVDGLEFRDSAWPDGGWTLQQLLMPEEGPEMRLAADFLVVVGRPHYATMKERGGVMVSIGFYGLTKVDETADLSALVVDLQMLQPVMTVTARTKGSHYGAGFVYGLFIIPDIDKGVIRGLSRGVAEVLAEKSAAKSLRVVVMAAESHDSSDVLTGGRPPLD